ncbi:hypothetical protein EGR_10554 [Echinococcus granulosus]|uniref:Uncharacterized protein n=1 Tax=Echinococcus granulosus TaxID=6210 RepID=W6U0F3_ECHGR|nr:hypothetical protein EGR_10554 [Echinococcus granulosus]EUB54585.1 hypothetical protein EGR_10554 [Echinococcus granulosus]
MEKITLKLNLSFENFGLIILTLRGDFNQLRFGRGHEMPHGVCYFSRHPTKSSPIKIVTIQNVRDCDRRNPNIKEPSILSEITLQINAYERNSHQQEKLKHPKLYAE